MNPFTEKLIKFKTDRLAEGNLYDVFILDIDSPDEISGSDFVVTDQTMFSKEFMQTLKIDAVVRFSGIMFLIRYKNKEIDRLREIHNIALDKELSDFISRPPTWAREKEYTPIYRDAVMGIVTNHTFRHKAVIEDFNFVNNNLLKDNPIKTPLTIAIDEIIKK